MLSHYCSLSALSALSSLQRTRINDQKRELQKALRRQEKANLGSALREEVFRQLSELAPIGIYRTDGTGTVST